MSDYEEQDIRKTEDEETAVQYLTDYGIVRYQNHVLKDDSVDDTPIIYLDDLNELPLGYLEKE